MEEKPLVEFTWNLVQKGFFKKKNPGFCSYLLHAVNVDDCSELDLL